MSNLEVKENNVSENYVNDIINILNNYDRVMVLKIFVDSNDEELRRVYTEAAKKHNEKIKNNPSFIDAGFDLYAPGNEDDELEYNCYKNNLRFFGVNWTDASPVNKLDYKICCSAKMYTHTQKVFNTGYYLYPRSSISKTRLRLANSTGIIDAGYRGHIMAMFDVVNIHDAEHDDDTEADYWGEKLDRYVQICAPGLVPILVEIVDSKDLLGELTERGSGGFGSTGR
jgi:dUTPase